MPSDFFALTAKQKKVYSEIEAYIKSKGIPPTVREIGELVGEKTPGAVQGILNRLEQKGVIKREVGMARSIKLVMDQSQYAAPIYVPELKKVSSRNIESLFSVYNIIRYQPISPDLISNEDKCFALECPDNSLSESGIQYGDMLLLKRNFERKDGDIFLVLYDNHVMLRRFYQGNLQGKIVLKAENSVIDKEIFDSGEVVFVGRLCGKFRKY